MEILPSTMKSLKREADPRVANIASKVFIRSARSGRIQKIVREQYLRKDIPCSSKLCPTCPTTAPADANGVGEFTYDAGTGFH